MSKRNNQHTLSKQQIDSVISLFSSGQFQDAIDKIKVLNEKYPNVPLLFNLIGACYKGLGQIEASVQMFETAIALKTDYAEAHKNLGISYKVIGRLDDAANSFKQAINIDPDYVDAHFNLGITLQELNQLTDAMKCYKHAIEINSDFAEAHNNLGNILKELGEIESSVKCFKNAITIRANFAEAHNNLGNALNDLNQFDKAIKSYENAIEIKPNFAEAYNNLGNSLRVVGQSDRAIKSYNSAIENKLNFVEAHNNLGILLKELGQIEAAIKSFEKVINLKPDFAEAYNNLGLAHTILGQTVEAYACYNKALEINPNYAYAHNNLGSALGVLGKKEASLKSYERAVALKPDYAEAYNNLGNVLRNIKRRDEALVCYERANSLKPDVNYLFGALMNTKMHLCIWNNFENNLKTLQKKINNSDKAIGPFALMGMIDDPGLQKKAAEIFANDLFPKNKLLSDIKIYSKHSKIRIGYFSADYKVHPTSFLSAELYETHDRSQFEVHAFSFGRDTKDEMNLRIKAGVDHFHNILSMSDEDVVRLSRSLEIDIAVDLGGYTANSRTKVFAMSVAPIQVNYLGYPGSMQAEFMDYIVADHTVIAKEQKHNFSEKIVYMPNSYQVNVSNQNTANNKLLRQELGLPDSGFIFCCFNNAYKITPTIFYGWMRILKAVKGSVLWLLVNNDSAIENLKKEAEQLGVNRNRLVFAPHIPIEEHLNRIKYADLFLDTHPYNAHTTTSDALRMELPVLTCIGKSFASRVAASLLNAVNVPELITTSQKDYEELAIKLATDSERFKIIKNKLRKNIPSAPLYDTPLFTKHLESAFRVMHDRYQQGLEPDHIYVEI